MSSEEFDDQEDEITQMNVGIDDPDATADRPRALAQAAGLLPADYEPSTMAADPDKLRQLAAEAAQGAEDAVHVDEEASIVSFVSNVSVVTQSVEAPAPAAGPMPAEVEPATMGSITLEPRSHAGPDAEPITIEPRMGVRGMTPGGTRGPYESESSSDLRQKLVIPEDLTTDAIARSDLLAAVAEETRGGLAGAPAPAPAPAAAPRGAPRPARPGKQTVVGLGGDPGKASAASAPAGMVRGGTIPYMGPPPTEPIPTAPMRERSNSEEALIAKAIVYSPHVLDEPPRTLAIPGAPVPSPSQAPQAPLAPKASQAPQAQKPDAAAKSMPPRGQAPLPPAVAVADAAAPAAGSSPGATPAKASGSSPGTPPADGAAPSLATPAAATSAAPAATAAAAAPASATASPAAFPFASVSRTQLMLGALGVALFLLFAGGYIGWKLRGAHAVAPAPAAPVSGAVAASSAPPDPAASASAHAEPKVEPERKADVEPKAEPEKNTDIELKNDSEPDKKVEAEPRSKPRGATNKPRYPVWRPTPKPWTPPPPPPKPSAKPPAPKPVATSFDPGGI